MMRATLLTLLALAGVAGADDQVVFRSDVNLVRVDAQVVDRDNRAITGLRAEDFVLREGGKELKVSNFASENMPVDLLLLLDVSASMQPHIRHISDASHQALRVLRDSDRVGIMVFDRSTRVRLRLRNNPQDAERELSNVLRQETFRSGTDITRALFDAADYMRSNARLDARRAIVIVTDDQTEFNRDVDGVSRALTRADTILFALIAPDAMQYRNIKAAWAGPRSGMGGGMGGIIFGQPNGGYGGRRGAEQTTPTQPAGSREIAQRSGGDSASVYDASAFEDTLNRIRQRYALYFHIPPDARPGEERRIEVQLADSAYRHYRDAEIRYRRTYMAPDGPRTPGDSGPVVASRSSSSSVRAAPATMAARAETPGGQ